MLFTVPSADGLDVNTSGADGLSPVIESDKDGVIGAIAIVEGRPSLFGH